MSAAATSPTGTQAIDRAAQLLVLLVSDDDGRTLGDLVAETGLPKSTASRLLRALERHGLAQRDRGRLRPGPVLVRYAQRGGGTAALVTVAQPTLERLGEISGETVNLAVPAPGGADQVAQVSSRYMLAMTDWVGTRAPSHASATGKVFLAHGVVEVADERLRRLTPRTITTAAGLRRELAEVRARGYATTLEELEPGLVAIAAPVRDAAGEVVAAVSISGPSFRLSPDRLESLAALLIDEVARLEQRLDLRQGTRREFA